MRLALFCLALVALFIASYLLWGEQFERMLAPRDGDPAAYLRSFGRWAWAVAIALLIADVLLPIPATAILAMLGMIYGPLLGGLIGCAGSFAAGSAAYLLCRSLGPRAARLLVGQRNLQRSERFFLHAGGWTIALSRWMIILPELVSCLAGLTRMPPRLYFTALACGTVPMCFTYAWIGSANLKRPILAISVSAAVPVLLWPVARWLLRRKANREPLD